MFGISLKGWGMKLIMCKSCRDVFNIKYKKIKTCSCGESSGYYADSTNATYDGPCILIGFENISFTEAISLCPKEGLGQRFDAFIIPFKCKTFKKKKGPQPKVV